VGADREEAGMPSTIERLPHAIEGSEAVDRLLPPFGKLSGAVLRTRSVADVLEGVPWLGHPLHPMLTDLPIGMWTSAVALDLLGGEAAEAGADALVGLGVVASLPTAAAGLAEYGRVGPPTIRVAAAHAAANTVALACMSGSWILRRSGRRGLGTALSLVGAGALALGGYLGGHLAYGKGVGVAQSSARTATEASGSIDARASVVAGDGSR